RSGTARTPSPPRVSSPHTFRGRPMTEAEWLAATDPRPMLEFIQGTGSDRMRVLTASGICRRLWEAYPLPVFQTAITICERYADRRITPGELRRLTEVLLARTGSIQPATNDPDYSMKRGICYSILMLADMIVDLEGISDVNEQILYAVIPMPEVDL